ncbi:hypothetical protein AMTRI_Chr09g14370 [Amborella trichopoda]
MYVCLCFKVIYVASFVNFIAFCSLSLALFVKFEAIYYHSLYLCFLNDTNFVKWGLNSKVFVGTALIDLCLMKWRGNFPFLRGKLFMFPLHNRSSMFPHFIITLYLCFLNDTNFVKFRAMKVS